LKPPDLPEVQTMSADRRPPMDPGELVWRDPDGENVHVENNRKRFTEPVEVEFTGVKARRGSD